MTYELNMNAFGLVKAAAEDSGLALPWNLHHVEYSGVETGFRATMSDEKIVVAFAGWVRELNKFKAIRRVLWRTQSAGGMNSPYTTLNLWDLFRKYPRALELEKKLWQTKLRAVRILSAFGGQTPSWQLIAHALMHTPDQYRAGMIAAAGTLAHGYFENTRDAKEFLVRYHLCKQVDASNQQQTLIDPNERHEERIGSYDFARVYLAMDVVPFCPYGGDPEPLRFWWLVKSDGGRVFHYSLRQERFGGFDGNFIAESTPGEAVQAAKNMWVAQDAFLEENLDIAHFIMQGGEILPEDWKAAYGSTSIQSLVHEMNWADRESFPGLWLLPHMKPFVSEHVRCPVRESLKNAWRRVHPLGSPKQKLPQKVYVSEHVAAVKAAGITFEPSVVIPADQYRHNRAISGGASIFIVGCRTSDAPARLIVARVRDLLFDRAVSHDDMVACIKRLGYKTAEPADALRFASRYDGDEKVRFVTSELTKKGDTVWFFTGTHKRIGLRGISGGYEPDELIVFRAA